jgi:hypothetical protein
MARHLPGRTAVTVEKRRNIMTTFTIRTLTAGALVTAAFVGAAPAHAAPTGPANAEDAISQLEDRGVRVVLDRQDAVGDLGEAEVFSVRLDAGDNVAYVTVR